MANTDRLKWDHSRTEYFTNLLVDQFRKGKVGDNGWKPEAWAYMVDDFNKKFQLSVNIGQLKAYVQYLKKEFAVIDDMIHQSGFEFNPTTKMVEITSEVWDAYLKTHKEARKWRHSSIPLYNEWHEIFEGRKADGRKQQTTLPPTTTPTPCNDLCMTPPYYTEIDSGEEDSISSPITKDSDKKGKKRQGSIEVKKGYQKRMKETIDLVETVQGLRDDFKKNPLSQAQEQIVEAMRIIMNMPNFTAVKKADISNVIRKENAALTFMMMDTATQIAWIERELNK